MEEVLAAVPEGKTRITLWDDDVTGYGLRCLDTGTKSNIFQGRPRGMGRAAPSRTITVGQWPTLSVVAARKIALGHAGAMAKGLDPSRQRGRQ